MRIIACLLLSSAVLFTNLTCYAENTSSNLIETLRAELKDYSVDNASLSSTKQLNKSLEKILAKPELIDQVCNHQPTTNEKRYCDKSVFSFRNEATGLYNSLDILIPIMKECHGDSSCINEKAGYLFSIMPADVAQLRMYLSYA